MKLSYELPNIRCITCNNPIGHLHSIYKEYLALGLEKIEIYNMLNLTNYCCRSEITFPPNYTINHTNQAIIMGNKDAVIPDNLYQQNNITDLDINYIDAIVDQPYLIKTNHRYATPVSITVSDTRRKLNDELYLSYVGAGTYKAR